jgi:ankyrin repeat protein
MIMHSNTILMSTQEAMKLIHSAASTGNENQLNELTGVYKRIVLARDEEGAQPLHVSVRAGHENVARKILKIFPQGAAVPDWAS